MPGVKTPGQLNTISLNFGISFISKNQIPVFKILIPLKIEMRFWDFNCYQGFAF